MKSDPSVDNSKYVTIERWFQDHYTMLCQRALRLVKDKGIAEDLVQNTFFKLWRKGKTITMPDSVEAFLKRMVFNEAIDWLRKNKRYEAEYDEELLVSNPCELDINNNNQTEIVKKKLYEVLDQLPSRCHTVFVLSRFENLTYEEIANYLGISVKTVENQIGKALKHIRQNFPKDLLLFVLFFTDWIN